MVCFVLKPTLSWSPLHQPLIKFENAHRDVGNEQVAPLSKIMHLGVEIHNVSNLYKSVPLLQKCSLSPGQLLQKENVWQMGIQSLLKT